MSTKPKDIPSIGEGFAFAAWFRHRVWAYRFNGTCGGWACLDCRSVWLNRLRPMKFNDKTYTVAA